jgi:hypothetical protein
MSVYLDSNQHERPCSTAEKKRRGPASRKTRMSMNEAVPPPTRSRRQWKPTASTPKRSNQAPMNASSRPRVARGGQKSSKTSGGGSEECLSPEMIRRYAMGELTGRSFSEAKAHLDDCEFCTIQVEAMRELLEAMSHKWKASD